MRISRFNNCWVPFLFFAFITTGCVFDAKKREEQKKVALQKKRDEVYKGWKTVKGKHVSFSLPPGWSAEKASEKKSFAFLLRPSSVKKEENFYIFEFIELYDSDLSFQNAANGVIEYYTAKFKVLPQIMNNLDIQMFGLPAKEYDINIKTDSFMQPIKAYMVKKQKNLYLFSYFKDPREDKQLDELFVSIMGSVIIE